MNVIGLGGSIHDFSACLVQDGRVPVAIEAERLARQKHCIDKQALAAAIESRQFWKLRAHDRRHGLDRAIAYCLEAAGLQLKDVDLVVSTDTLAYRPALGARPVLRINHHLGHAASAFYPSGLDEAAILVADGNGSMVRCAGTQEQRQAR
jgi:carbamoyltransferase